MIEDRLNDEIKEILDNFKIYEDRYKKCNETQFIIFYRDIRLLLDYITNLQQKYKNSKITLAEEWKKRLEAEEKIKHLDNQIIMLKQQNNVIAEMGLNYKSRIEKTIEYINTHYLNANEPVLLDILKGDDKNEK